MVDVIFIEQLAPFIFLLILYNDREYDVGFFPTVKLCPGRRYDKLEVISLGIIPDGIIIVTCQETTIW